MIVGLLALACSGPDEHGAADGATITVLLDGDERALGPAADDNQKFLVFLAMVQGYRDPTNRLADRRERSTDYRVMLKFGTANKVTELTSGNVDLALPFTHK